MKTYTFQASEDQVRYAREYLKEGSVANRGVFDGDEYKQLFGIQAQTLVADYLGVPRPKNEKGFDGGWDILFKGKRWDVKCEQRNVSFKPRVFVHNVAGSQINYEKCDGYIFVSYNREMGDFTICGWISKEGFKEHATFHPVGSVRQRSDGTYMKVQGSGGLFEIKQAFLQDMEVLKCT
jgi:hypothetical protein